MSVQVIMKDGLPEWAVIPYAQYEALLAAAASLNGAQNVAPVSATAVDKSEQGAPKGSFFAGMKESSGVNARFNAAKFSALKAELGKSSSALAKDAGISPAYCDQIERGEREPSPAIIRGLAQSLKVKPDDLLA